MRIAVGFADSTAIAFVDAANPLRVLATGALEEFPELISRFEAAAPRWVWVDTRFWMPRLLASGVRVRFAYDLRLAGSLIEHALSTTAAPEPPNWLGAAQITPITPDIAGNQRATYNSGDTAGFSAAAGNQLLGWEDFELAAHGAQPNDKRITTLPSAFEVAVEDMRQQRLVANSDHPKSLALLLAAESAGAVVAAELQSAGLPWSRKVHEAVLQAELGARPSAGNLKPERLEILAAKVRDLLGAPSLNLDSQIELLRALRAVGLPVSSTSRWELRNQEHPALEPLLEYKSLSRLLRANGWNWLDEWVVDGRFRPEYVVSGSATGRWATSGGGALQLPKLLRRAVVADEGWVLVIADAAQLEPRILAAMSHDLAMAETGQGRDIYQGIVDAGVLTKRADAKIALLGAMYGATTGNSARLLPRLGRAFPRAMSLVENAAGVGEAGGQVTTWLGRTSPPVSPIWRTTQAKATQPEATAADERRARTTAREWGRFTRNFVVQGTAAEWALCWLAILRQKLMDLEVAEDVAPAERSGQAFVWHPHLVYFLHDELIVHTPRTLASEVSERVTAAAEEAGRLIFGDFPIDFPLDLRVAESY